MGADTGEDQRDVDRRRARVGEQGGQPPAATRAAPTAVGTGPNRTPAPAVITEPATAPRLSANRKPRAEPRLKPEDRISWGSQVPKPYHAKSVARVAAANKMVGRVYGALSREAMPPPALAGGVTAPSRGLLVSNSGANVRGHGDAESILGSFRDNWNPEFHRRFMARNFHTTLDEEELQRFVSWAGSVPQQAAADALASQVSLDFSDRLGDISVPVVFGHERHDLARSVDSAESLTRRVSNSQLMLLEAGHSPMYEDVPGWTRALEALDVMIGQQV